MKVIMNLSTNFEGHSLSQGTEIDVPLNVAERWINRGLAHLPAIKDVDKDVEVKATPVKNFDEYVKDIPVKAEITYEDLDDMGPEVDVIEPIPIDKYVSFDEPKIKKPLKKKK